MGLSRAARADEKEQAERPVRVEQTGLDAAGHRHDRPHRRGLAADRLSEPGFEGRQVEVGRRVDEERRQAVLAAEQGGDVRRFHRGPRLSPRHELLER